MSGLANSGIKETKEALKSAIEEIAELEAELAAWKSDGPIAKARATTKYWKEKCDRLEAELADCKWMGKDVVDSRNEYKAENQRLREALEELLTYYMPDELKVIAKAALVKDES